MKIDVTSQNISFLECLSSETRVKMIELLGEKPMNIKELSKQLDISSAIVTRHIQKLEAAGIISTESTPGERGTQKICSLLMDQVILQFPHKKPDSAQRPNTVSIPIGQYSACEVKPTCGLASPTGIIGVVDDPRYFADPHHVQASLLWFGSGYVEYRIPNFLHGNEKLSSLEISFEICSEAPGYKERYPSDICFYINDIPIGMWTSPGDFGTPNGALTPSWWNRGTQYGLLKTVSVSSKGAYVDGIKMSHVTAADLGVSFGKEIKFKLASQEDAVNCGGISLFGKHFGNYKQDIEITMYHDRIAPEV